LGKKILITGAAGFIGYHLCKHLVSLDFQVYGLDNLNSYYDLKLKINRLIDLGFSKDELNKKSCAISSKIYKDKLKFIYIDICDSSALNDFFKKNNFDLVCHLAAQAGVRYSLKNPSDYINSNILGFFNLIDCCKSNEINRFVYASSSSVYGNNNKIPYCETDNVDNPISLYAATKKSNELIAYTYSHLYNIETIGLRFFTVYGPWGRPDMAYFLFTDAIKNNKPINVYNNGNLKRDFTYIDDIIFGMENVLLKDSKDSSLFKVYNIGNGKPVKLLDFIDLIERKLALKAKKNMLPKQPGDVNQTWADTVKLENDYGYQTKFSLDFGLSKFISWYNDYYKK
tara:strand:- start:204 stop:1226 length:1023 start_codon:yes stop_codon:yes gene_type:complete